MVLTKTPICQFGKKAENFKLKSVNNQFLSLDDLKGEGLALRYVLEGGIRHAENTSAAFTDPISVTSGELKSGWPKTQNAKNTAYGDVTTRSNSGEGYGIVPMPGITDATIKTKSAYGSLREAKVKFVCHNQRQLEILEMLYMRPGYNLLLEFDMRKIYQ